MKLLLNENLGRSAAEALRRRGHDVVWIGDRTPPFFVVASDSEFRIRA